MNNKYFDDLGIDPFEIVGVSRKCDKKSLKKEYLKRAMMLHPDKNQGKTEVEFKLLVESYNYIKNCLEGKINCNAIDMNATDYKANFNDKELISYTRTKLNYNTNREAFVDHGLPKNVSDDQKNLDEIFKKRMNAPKEYNSNEGTAFNLFGTESYDKNQFNAMFEIHKEKFGCNSAFDSTNHDDPLGFECESTLKPLPILTYNGLIIEQPQKDVKLKYHEPPSKQFSLKDIKYKEEFKQKLKEVKNKENGLSQKELNKIINDKQLNKPIKVHNKYASFNEANEAFYQEKVKRMKEENENNRNTVEFYARNIYEPIFIEEYGKGRIGDSSTYYHKEELKPRQNDYYSEYKQ